MRRRSVLTAGAAGAAALLVGGTSAKAATLQQPATLPAGGAGDLPWASASLRDLAAQIGLRFGTALIPQDIETPSYAAIAGSQFSVVTPGNAMKWQIVEPEQGVYDWSQADQLVHFAEANAQLVRGHTLTWHNQLPDWLTSGVAKGSISASKLRALLHDHIITEVSRYRGKIWQWDVCNEFFTDTNPSGFNPDDFWVSNLGPDIIADAFMWAREADPHALLFYNDYNIGGEDGSNAKSDAVYAFVSSCSRWRAHPRRREPGPPGHPVRLEPATAPPGPGAVRESGPEGRHHRSRRAHLRERPHRPGADRQPGPVRAALRVLGDAQGGARRAAVHLLHRLGLHRLRLLGSGFLHRRGVRGASTTWASSPKAAYYALQSDLALAAFGAPHRVRTYQPFA